MLFVCAKCGTKNRIPDPPEPGKRYFCGKCKARLADISKAADARNRKSPTPQIAAAKDKKSAMTALVKALSRLSWVHPLLFALFPVLYFYSRNVAEVTPSQVVLPLIAALSFGVFILLLFLLIGGLIQKVRMRSAVSLRIKIWAFEKLAIVTTIFLTLFFSYGDALAILGLKWEVLAVVWISFFLILAFLVIRTDRPLRNVTGSLALVGAILVILPAITIIAHETRFGGHDVRTTETVGNGTLVLVDTEVLPDIYYIVPDRYGSASSLEKNFQFDNSEFIDYLSDKGFYVATSSHSNYARTFASLASSLNMEYINYLTDELGESFGANYPMWQLIHDNKVWRFLKSRGYKFINLGDKWDGTRWNNYADVNYNLYEVPEFSLLVFRKTLAYPFCRLLGIVDDDRTMHMKNTLYLFDKLAEIPSMEGPTFAFAHLCIPHDPFVFDSNGNYKTLHEEQQDSRRDNFVDQLIFANSKFKVLIDKLLTTSEVPPIIILQADEGPFAFEPWLGEKATEVGLEVKMGILNAYYLPGVDKDLLYPSITPVNSFRLVFDLYFDTNLGLLPDKCYAYDDGYPNKFRYRFIDVTDKLKHD